MTRAHNALADIDFFVAVTEVTGKLQGILGTRGRCAQRHRCHLLPGEANLGHGISGILAQLRVLFFQRRHAGHQARHLRLQPGKVGLADRRDSGSG